MRRFSITLLLSLASVATPLAHAEDGDATGNGPIGANATYELGFHLGEFLPNQIKGVTEIMGLGGGRLAFRISPLTYFETGLITGNGEGQEWKNAHGDIRMDIPVENLVGTVFLGADASYFASENHSDRLIFGGHAGGGIQTHLVGSCWFRGDMKFLFSPGTSLYFGFGLVWRLGTGTGGGD